jgi:hypothetical protein
MAAAIKSLKFFIFVPSLGLRLWGERWVWPRRKNEVKPANKAELRGGY